MLFHLPLLLHSRVTDKDGANGKTFECTAVHWHNGFTDQGDAHDAPSTIPAAFRDAYAAWLSTAGVDATSVQKIAQQFSFTETTSATKVDTETETKIGATTETDVESEVEVEDKAEGEVSTEVETPSENRVAFIEAGETKAHLTGSSAVLASTTVGNGALEQFQRVIEILQAGRTVFPENTVTDIIGEAVSVEPDLEEVPDDNAAGTDL